MIHEFQPQLDYSEKASEEPFWEAVYKKAFPNMVNCMQCKGDTVSQRIKDFGQRRQRIEAI